MLINYNTVTFIVIFFYKQTTYFSNMDIMNIAAIHIFRIQSISCYIYFKHSVHFSNNAVVIFFHCIHQHLLWKCHQRSSSIRGWEICVVVFKSNINKKMLCSILFLITNWNDRSNGLWIKIDTPSSTPSTLDPPKWRVHRQHFTPSLIF